MNEKKAAIAVELVTEDGADVDVTAIRKSISDELSSVDPAVRDLYHAEFAQEIEDFTEAMTAARVELDRLFPEIDRNRRVVYVANIVHCAIALHLQSMKLFLSGHNVAAGNLSRQVVEAVATAALCASLKTNFLERFINDEFDGSSAVTNARRHHEKIGLSKVGVAALERFAKSNHSSSHFSKMTVAYFTAFDVRALYVGAAFDEGKRREYGIWLGERVAFARIFPNFIKGVRSQVALWPTDPVPA